MTLSRKQVIGLLVSVVVLAVASYGIWLISASTDPYKGLVTQREVHIDEATREYFAQRLATTLASIEATERAGQDVDPDMYLSAASDAYSIGDLVTAREMLEKQLAVNSLNYVAWNNYSLVLEAMEDYEDADVAYQKTIELEHGIPKYYEDYANFLMAHYPERREELKALYEDDLARRGQTVWNMTGLGNWYAAAGECDKAIDHYEVALVLLPNNQALKDDFESMKNTCVEADE